MVTICTHCSHGSNEQNALTWAPEAGAFISVTSWLSVSGKQCLPKGALENRASLLKNKAHHLVHLLPWNFKFQRLDNWAPVSWQTHGVCITGSNEVLLLAFKTKCWGVFQLLQFNCLSDSVMSIRAFHLIILQPPQLSLVAIHYLQAAQQLSLIWAMLLHIKRYLSAQFSFFLVWNQLCSPQVVWPWAEPGTVWWSRFQVCIIALSALLPSQSSVKVKWELWGKGLVNWQSEDKH